jgi:hypothetical protein
LKGSGNCKESVFGFLPVVFPVHFKYPKQYRQDIPALQQDVGFEDSLFGARFFLLSLLLPKESMFRLCGMLRNHYQF